MTLERLGTLSVETVHQEHGTVPVPDDTWFGRLPIGSTVRILPNHACLTCAPYLAFDVVAGGWRRGSLDPHGRLVMATEKPMTPTTTPKLTEVRCAGVPPPGGHYAQAVLHGGLLHVSGQLGITRDTPEPRAVPVADQVGFALANIERIARVVGAGRTDVVKCTVFVTGIEHWDEANLAYADFFGAHRPARSVVPCSALHFGAKVEIEAVVAVGR